MANTNAVSDLEGADNFVDRCNKLQSTLFPVIDQMLPNIPDNFVISKCNLSESFNTVSRSEVKRGLKAVNCNSAVGSDKVGGDSLVVPSWLALCWIALGSGFESHRGHLFFGISPRGEISQEGFSQGLVSPPATGRYMGQ
jgi:hypothetical protein